MASATDEPTYTIELYEPSGSGMWRGVLRGPGPARATLAEASADSASLVIGMLYAALEDYGVDAPGPGD